MEPLIDSREVTLVTPGGMTATVIVRALTGLDKESAPTLAMIEETLKAANC